MITNQMPNNIAGAIRRWHHQFRFAVSAAVGGGSAFFARQRAT
jgi:hypothetical protein